MSGHTLLKEYTIWKAVSQKLAMRWVCVTGRAAEYSVNLQKVGEIKKKGQHPDGISLWPSKAPHPGWILLYVCTYFWPSDTYQCYADSLHLPVFFCNGTKGKSPVLVPSEFRISFGEVQEKGWFEDWSPCRSPKNHCCSMQFFYFVHKLVQISL